jgi:REP element-mobilizing transposase RayT
MSREPELRITRRNLPHWILEGAIYFETFRVLTGVLPDEEMAITYEHIKKGNSRFYLLIALVVMPNHVHMLLKPLEKYDLSRIMKGTKGVSSRLINTHRNATGNVWQDESFDRIVRDLKELHEKINYMYMNPVKAGLVEGPDDYPFWLFDPEWDKEWYYMILPSILS